jgi:hypothetical protein
MTEQHLQGSGTPGRRLPDGQFPERQGDYSKVIIDGAVRWFNWPPGCPWPGMLRPYESDGGLFHEVDEHEDGTITVKASILMRETSAPSTVQGGGIVAFGGWHGYLEHGIWREA